MGTPINYEDNTFIVNTRIRLLNDIFVLDAEPSLFFTKSLDELDFINSTLEALLAKLSANEKLIEKDEQFHNLLETEWRFISLLNFLISGQGSLANNFVPALVPKLESIHNDSKRRQEILKEKVSSNSANQMDVRMVSSFELSELLKE